MIHEQKRACWTIIVGNELSGGQLTFDPTHKGGQRDQIHSA